jgi:antitoxin ParD1/3/4
MSLHVNLSKEMEAFIRSKVESGFYGNATEVIRDAIRRLQQDDARIAAFRAAIAEGDADIERGDYEEYTPELMDRLAQQALDDLEAGKPIDPAVMP